MTKYVALADIVAHPIDVSVFQNLDLARTEKLCVQNYGWSIEKARQVAVGYRQYLALFALYPNTFLVATRDIDDMWHQHVLDTRTYHADCTKLFGHYLHHVPVIQAEKATLQPYREACEATMRLIEQQFGTRPDQQVSAVCTYDEEDDTDDLNHIRAGVANAVCFYDDKDAVGMRRVVPA